jgi:hypothetical protein
VKNAIKEAVEQFREEYPGGVQEFLRVLRQDWAERLTERQRRRPPQLRGKSLRRPWPGIAASAAPKSLTATFSRKSKPKR